MRRFITTLTLAALVGSGIAPAARSQSALDPGAAERLRAAISRQQAVGGDRFRDPAALDALVAPVALYPDALLDQVLAAATYPDQVRAAGRILDDAPDLSRSELEDELAERTWDPSVLTLLSDFPTVIGRMAADMTWTSQLGGAVIDQNDDVQAAVQRQRSRAYAAGNLVSGGPQVITRSADRIFIAPARSGNLYAPTYDTRTVYTVPNAPPPPPAGGQGLAPSPLVAGALAFGTALLIGELTKDNHKRDRSDERRRDDWDRSGDRRRDDWDRRAPRQRPNDWRDRPVIYPGPDFRGFERVDVDRDAARAAERRRDRAEEERQDARQARRREEARKEARDDRRKSERREEARREREKANRAEEARQDKRREERAGEDRRYRRKAERSEDSRKDKRREERGKASKAERRQEGERPRAERRGGDDRRKAQRETRQPDRDRSEPRGESRKKKGKECREDDRECRRR